MIWRGAIGLIIICAIAWLLSENRRRIPWRTVLSGLALQLFLGVLLLKVPAFRSLFLGLNAVMESIVTANESGTSFVFGYLGGGPLPFEKSGATEYIFAFRALMLILFISALSALLYHWRILPVIVGAMSKVLQKTMGVGGAVGLGTASNVFLGMVEAPLLVRPYVSRMSRGELFAVMTSGMATIAGTVMVLYATILAPVIPESLGHILIASLLNAPAGLVIAALMVPPGDRGTEAELAGSPADSTMDAITRGTVEGAQLLINIVAMLIVLVALVSLLNQGLALLPHLAGGPLTLQRLLGYLLAPLVFLIGIPWGESVTAGSLMGTKIVLNELVGYLEFAKLPADALSMHSRLIMVYAMCGFANFGSVGIMIGGMGTMVPERRAEIGELGMLSIVSGVLTTCASGAVAGLLTL
jgi:CNT family concentrative nucleoside transporter